ncbi:Protein NipSnap -like protein 1 [Ceratocystis lukuohia]|uniref:Protein NipSnap-like protein 1 n=2 Tax=Ceratocystis TaxID=5157 RepID=A0A2C5X285_9PEZI|nr:Protein NipSnap -like protein 1 [Ceratocystis fimbriata CBS 114723]
MISISASRPYLPALRHLAAATPVVRTFTSSARLTKHTPAIGDINPSKSSVSDFDAKQSAFRQQLAETSKTRNTELANELKNAPSDEVYVPPGLTQGHGLGSLSTATDKEKKGILDDTGKKQGKLSSLIYGTKEGREMDAQIEASFSAILARGKYVHSIVLHDVKPDKVDEYSELVGEFYPRMAQLSENKVNLVGSWRTEIGDSDTFVHIWEYHRYHGYHESRYAITHHPDYVEFNKKLRTLIYSKKISLMQEFSFWPTSPPRELGGIFELRSYTLHPGNLLEWEHHWRRGLEARREVMEGVGAWFTQIGELNTVHHLWQFPNLEERKLRRDRSWGVKGWSETVHKTVPLIQSMKSRILIPMPWSPVR